QARRETAKWRAAEVRLKIDALRRERDQMLAAAETGPDTVKGKQAEIEALMPVYEKLRQEAGF
ncbi:MAG: hypothetical protein AAF711_06360, partial [Planctomycetota bacterium]